MVFATWTRNVEKLDIFYYSISRMVCKYWKKRVSHENEPKSVLSCYIKEKGLWKNENLFFHRPSPFVPSAIRCRLSLMFHGWASRIRLFLIRQTGEVIHAGIQRDGDPPALFIGQIASSVFNFGIIALVDPCQMLHFDLGVAFFFSQFL